MGEKFSYFVTKNSKQRFEQKVFVKILEMNWMAVIYPKRWISKIDLARIEKAFHTQ